MRAQPERVTHTFGPFFDRDSQILILGSMPSRASRQQAFYYAHPRNRFWPVMACLCGQPLDTLAQRKAFLHQFHFALWDVINSCIITGSSDASIRDVRVNDVKSLLGQTSVHTIATTGAAAYRLYQQYLLPATGVEALALPSTSPANAAWSLSRLSEAYAVLFEKLRKEVF